MNINHYSMLKKLGVFASVVEQGSFTAAAEVLGTAQPWVSVQVQQLEQSLGVPLLVREARTVKLTPEGEVIFPMAQRMMAKLADVMATRPMHGCGEPSILVMSVGSCRSIKC